MADRRELPELFIDLAPGAAIEAAERRPEPRFSHRYRITIRETVVYEAEIVADTHLEAEAILTEKIRKAREGKPASASEPWRYNRPDGKLTSTIVDTKVTMTDVRSVRTSPNAWLE